MPACWTERPASFAAAAAEPDAAKRALLVLRWFLLSLKSQFYVAGRIDADAGGVKKPLNAFLGELFIGEWSDGGATTRLVVEQVSHHPPVTACYMYDEANGVRAEGYTRVEMTFSGGAIQIRQTGHAILHLDGFDEDYLIPIPGFKVKGFMTGTLYPELEGTHHIVSSAGFTSEITFSGAGLFSRGKKNSFDAKVYRSDDSAKAPVYSAEGQWTDSFTIMAEGRTEPVETCIIDEVPPAKVQLPAAAEQDPFESRAAWGAVLRALQDGHIEDVMREKSKLENAQRSMRKEEDAKGTSWKPQFFVAEEADPRFEALAKTVGEVSIEGNRTQGVWRFDRERWGAAQKPFRGELTPLG